MTDAGRGSQQRTEGVPVEVGDAEGVPSEVESVGRPPTETVDQALAVGRRRLVVSYLLHADQPVTLTSVARHVAAAEANCRTSVVPTSLLQSTYLNLRETHVPVLEAASLVEYESAVGRVDLAPMTDAERARLDSRLGRV
jgi:hypothetical protein